MRLGVLWSPTPALCKKKAKMKTMTIRIETYRNKYFHLKRIELSWWKLLTARGPPQSPLFLSRLLTFWWTKARLPWISQNRTRWDMWRRLGHVGVLFELGYVHWQSLTSLIFNLPGLPMMKITMESTVSFSLLPIVRGEVWWSVVIVG